jgi:hypothetical protein
VAEALRVGVFVVPACLLSSLASLTVPWTPEFVRLTRTRQSYAKRFISLRTMSASIGGLKVGGERPKSSRPGTEGCFSLVGITLRLIEDVSH